MRSLVEGRWILNSVHLRSDRMSVPTFSKGQLFLLILNLVNMPDQVCRKFLSVCFLILDMNNFWYLLHIYEPKFSLYSLPQNWSDQERLQQSLVCCSLCTIWIGWLLLKYFSWSCQENSSQAELYSTSCCQWQLPRLLVVAKGVLFLRYSIKRYSSNNLTGNSWPGCSYIILSVVESWGSSFSRWFLTSSSSAW